jgi:hypothetical protein
MPGAAASTPVWRDGILLADAIDPSAADRPHVDPIVRMIISHRYRYVFVELPRTGSTAVSAELREHYDGERVLRKHATYRDFLRQASDDEARYFVFSTIRNPLDIAVTRYVHLRENPRGHFTDPNEIAVRNSIAGRLERRVYRWLHEHDASFEAFLLRWYVVPYDTWSSLDHRRMDRVMRYESLVADFEEVLGRLGIEPVRPLPARNVTPGKDRDFASYYTQRAIKRATWIFGPYMDEWAYAFPDAWGRVRVPVAARLYLRLARVFRRLYWANFRYLDYVRRPVRNSST